MISLTNYYIQKDMTEMIQLIDMQYQKIRRWRNMKINKICKKVLICVGVAIASCMLILGISACQQKQQAEGGIPNIKNCALWHEGKIAQRPQHQGAKYVDSDVHKVLESMCMALDTDAAGDNQVLAAQTKIAAKLNE